ncbi:hypothetical protein [Thiobacillus thioparus]|uniref:hypothetical protein n=1 Tax=Thiobacillus thioparus TaxID=931 RepID=UPI0012F99029|nr:hypothetical protein [Thiobacillus thioparus]
MNEVKCDLTIRLDESGRKFLFFTTRKTVETGGSKQGPPMFSVEIDFDELKNRGGSGAEQLIGESVLGFFDHLTDGRLDLPKHYQD